MNSNATVSVRSLLLAGPVLAAPGLAHLLGGWGGTASSAQAADDETAATPGTRDLTMTGTGDASAVPAQLSFALAVPLTRPDLDEALDAANTSMSRVLAS